MSKKIIILDSYGGAYDKVVLKEIANSTTGKTTFEVEYDGTKHTFDNKKDAEARFDSFKTAAELCKNISVKFKLQE